MAKRLVIAEKPSVAADIARALGGLTRQGDYFEGDDTIVSSAVGHLLDDLVRGAGDRAGPLRQARRLSERFDKPGFHRGLLKVAAEAMALRG